MKKISLTVLCAALVSTAPTVAHACAVCISGANDPMAGAFNSSILFLMATPYAVGGSIGGWLYYRYRRSTRKPVAAEAPAPLGPLVLNHEEIGR